MTDPTWISVLPPVVAIETFSERESSISSKTAFALSPQASSFSPSA